MLRIYMGEGEGKTTAAAGIALRALSHHKKVRVLQFLKPDVSPEFKALEGLSSSYKAKAANLEIGFFFTLRPEEKLRRAQESLEAAEAFFEPEKDDFLLVLDEIGGALENGLLSPNAVLTFLDNLPKTTHLLFTGRYFPKEILERADLISEVQCVRHPYEAGICALEGLDY